MKKVILMALMAAFALVLVGAVSADNPPPQTPILDCNDGEDGIDPEDTLIDAQDPGCTYYGDDDETNGPDPNEVADQATSELGERQEMWMEGPTEAPEGVSVCTMVFLHHWRDFWWLGNNSWHHHFRPVFCRNGSVITSSDLSTHWQTCSGYYNCNGVSHYITAGCVGCSFIQARGVANLNWSWANVSRSFTRCWNVRMGGNGSWSHWLGCG
jgi:hypothetical protein